MSGKLSGETFLVFSAFIVLILSASYCSAIGISPSRSTVFFQPGLQETHEFYVINNADELLEVELYKKGELADYVTLEKEYSIIGANDRELFTYELNLPESLNGYGIFDTRIGAREADSDESSMMGGRAGVESQLWVIKLYEGSYCEVKLTVNDAYTGTVVSFGVNVFNFGTESIEGSGVLEISDSSSQKVTSIDLGEASIGSAEFEELYASWDTGEADAAAGQYSAKVVFVYSGEESSAQKWFSLIDKDSENDDSTSGGETSQEGQSGGLVIAPEEQQDIFGLNMSEIIIILIVLVIFIVVIIYFIKNRGKSDSQGAAPASAGIVNEPQG